MITPARFGSRVHVTSGTPGNKWKRELPLGKGRAEDLLDSRKPIPSKTGIDGNIGVEISFDWKSRGRGHSTSNAGDVSWVFLGRGRRNLERAGIRCSSIDIDLSIFQHRRMRRVNERGDLRKKKEERKRKFWKEKVGRRR